MPSAFDELMDEARDAGVDPEWIDRVVKASAGSPIRKERDEAKAQLEQAIADASRYRTAALASQFKELGIKVKPDALNIPPDLDPLDESAIREWAVGMGLAEPPPPQTPPEEQDAHQRLVDAAAGGQTPQARTARDEVLSANSREEFLAKAAAGGFLAQT